MKKFLMIAVLVAALTAAFATSAFAAPSTPVTPVPGSQAGSGFGYGAGDGFHTPGTGLAQGAGMGARRGAPEWAVDNETAAGIVGLSVQELQAERLSGKSLAQIAVSKCITEDALIAKLSDARKTTVNELLTAGKITQAQADFMLNSMAQNMKMMVERTNVGRPAFAGQSPMAGTRGGAGIGRLNKWPNQ